MTLNNLKLTIATAVALSLASLATQAGETQTLSFTGTSKVTGGITMVVPGAGEIGSFNTSGESTTTFADGSKMSETNTCAAMANRSGGMYAMSGYCQVTDKDKDIYGMAFDCNYRNDDQANVVCVGSLYGTSGKYDGRVGVASWTNIHGLLVGTGQWN
jgi:hypothetical protein